MAALVRLIIDPHTSATTLRLPELPLLGDRIELADGTSVVVREIEPRQRGIVTAEVRAELA
jgi:hypothetical protein